MRAKVIVSFVDKNWFTRSKGQDFVSDDEAYITSLVEDGKIELIDEPTSDNSKDVTSSNGKARKSNARKTILSRRGRR